MSRGIEVKAKLILQDDKTVIYEYGSYNWNEENYRNIEQVCDGIAPFMLFVFAISRRRKHTGIHWLLCIKSKYLFLPKTIDFLLISDMKRNLRKKNESGKYIHKKR